MTEISRQMVEEEHGSTDRAGRYTLVDPHPSKGSTLNSGDDDVEFHSTNQGFSDRSDSSLASSLFHDALNCSTASVGSNLFTHSWSRPATYNIPDLCSYIASTPPTPITLLKWCKNQDGVKHEFLLVKIERIEDGSTIWLRLDRQRRTNAKAANSISSPVPSGDTVKLCTDVSSLFDGSQSRVQVETKFTAPVFLHRLGGLLSILMEDSPDYKWYSENCFFFCAVIYENLVSVGQGVNVSGAPRKISLSLAPELKARIKKRLESLEPSPGIPSLDLRGVFPMGAVSTTPPSGRLPNEFSVAEEREEIARKYRPIPSGKSRSFVRLERPQTAASERVGVFQRLQRLCGFF